MTLPAQAQDQNPKIDISSSNDRNTQPLYITTNLKETMNTYWPKKEEGVSQAVLRSSPLLAAASWQPLTLLVCPSKQRGRATTPIGRHCCHRRVGQRGYVQPWLLQIIPYRLATLMEKPHYQHGYNPCVEEDKEPLPYIGDHWRTENSDFKKHFWKTCEEVENTQKGTL